MTDLPLARDEFDALAEDIATLIEETVAPPDRRPDATTAVKEHLEEWYTVDELEFGRAAVWHSLEDAEIRREDRFAIIHTLSRDYEWLREDTDEQ